jgi:hypothetical protein
MGLPHVRICHGGAGRPYCLQCLRSPAALCNALVISVSVPVPANRYRLFREGGELFLKTLSICAIWFRESIALRRRVLPRSTMRERGRCRYSCTIAIGRQEPTICCNTCVTSLTGSKGPFLSKVLAVRQSDRNPLLELPTMAMTVQECKCPGP